MLLEQYIYQLVIENESVIIPNFGAFISNICEANIDFNKQEFFSPKREIRFLSELNHNDFVLADFLSKKKNISLETANNLIQTFVDEMFKQLKSGESIRFYKLGTFNINSDKLEFIPNSKNNFDDDLYGLTDFVFPLLASEKPTVIITENSKQKPKRKLGWVFVPAAAAVISGVLFLNYQTDIFNSQNININWSNIFPTELFTKTHTNNTINNSIAENNNSNDKKDVDVVVTDSSLENIEVVENQPETTIDGNKEQSKIVAYAIAGGFSILQNAENLRDKLIKDGFPAEILPIKYGLHKVAVKSYTSNEDADKDLANLRQTTNNYEIWILKDIK